MSFDYAGCLATSWHPQWSMALLLHPPCLPVHLVHLELHLVSFPHPWTFSILDCILIHFTGSVKLIRFSDFSIGDRVRGRVMREAGETLDGTRQLDQCNLWLIVKVIRVETFFWKVQVIIRGQIWGIAFGEVWISRIIVIIEICPPCICPASSPVAIQHCMNDKGQSKQVKQPTFTY